LAKNVMLRGTGPHDFIHSKFEEKTDNNVRTLSNSISGELSSLDEPVTVM